MIRLYPEGKRRYQFKAFIGRDEPQQAKAIAHWREKGAMDFIQAIAKDMTEELDKTRYGTIVKLDAVAMPIDEYEKLIMEAFEHGRSYEMQSQYCSPKTVPKRERPRPTAGND